MRLVTLHLNARVKDVVLGEANAVSEVLEQFTQFSMSLGVADAFPFPNAILSENADNSILIVIVVTNIAVFGFEFLNGFRILQNGDVLYQFRCIHSQQASFFASRVSCRYPNLACGDGVLRMLSPQDTMR
jgi:hypothetical protein